MALPKVKPIVNRLFVDSEGNLCVQTNEVKKEGDKEFTAFDIFNPDGFYDARVWLDTSPERFANGKMYRMAEDAETGLYHVKRYRVTQFTILRQRRLTVSTLFEACPGPFLVVVPGFLPCPVPGPFLDTSFLMCQESTALAIRNGPFSTGCFFIISSGSSRNMRGVLSGNTASSGRSSRM